MSRIRSIKPEFWTDEKVVMLSPLARLVFIGLWNFVDDHGRIPCSPARMKMQILPADSADFPQLLAEISGMGLVTIYDVDGKQFLQVNGFDKHQKIDKRAISKYPAPPNPPASPPKLPLEGKGREKEREKDSEAKASAPIVASIDGEITEAAVYRFGDDVLGQNSGGQVTKLRKMFGNNPRKVHDVLVQARQKGNARQWIAGVLKGSEFAAPTADEICPPDIYENVL